MKLKPFVYHRPETIQRCLELASEYEPREYVFMGGGTDLLVRLRQCLLQPKAIISLRTINSLKGLEVKDGYLEMGASTTLAEVIQSPLVTGYFPALVETCRRIATFPIRNMATIGGNIFLERRCSYYNQMVWTGGFKPCFKRGGDLCYMMPRGDRCHAIFVADTPPMLMVLDARLHLIGPTGEKEIPVGDFYRQDGMKGGTFSEGEILTKIKIPFKKRLKLSYVRTSARKAIDFPEPGVAVAIELGERSQITNIRVAATGLLSKPIRLNSVEKSLMREGEIVSSPEKLEISLKGLTVLPHHGVSVWYRREMFKVLVKRAIAGAMSKDKS